MAKVLKKLIKYITGLIMGVNEYSLLGFPPLGRAPHRVREPLERRVSRVLGGRIRRRGISGIFV